MPFAGGGWWGGGGYSYSRGGTYPTFATTPAAPPPTTPKATPVSPPTTLPPSQQLPSTPTASPNQPATPPNNSPNPNTPGQNNDGGSPGSSSLLSRILSANPSITQSATRTTMTIDGSVVVVMGVYTDNSMSTIYQTLPTQPNAAQAGSTETPGTLGGSSAERAHISPGTIAGALIGGILAALLASWAVWCFWKRSRRTRASEAFAHIPNEPGIGTLAPYTSPSSEPSFGTYTPRTPRSPDDDLSSPAYTDTTNDVLISQSVLPLNEKSRIYDAPIAMEQPQRPALAQLFIPRNDTINHLRTPSRSSLTTYRTEMTSPPLYATIFNNQPMPSFRRSQLVSPLSPPQDSGPSTISAWTKQPQPYDVERGLSVGPSGL